MPKCKWGRQGESHEEEGKESVQRAVCVCVFRRERERTVSMHSHQERRGGEGSYLKRLSVSPNHNPQQLTRDSCQQLQLQLQLGFGTTVWHWGGELEGGKMEEWKIGREMGGDPASGRRHRQLFVLLARVYICVQLGAHRLSGDEKRAHGGYCDGFSGVAGLWGGVRWWVL